LLGLGIGIVRRNSGESPISSQRLDECIALLDRVNCGNPDYKPYEVKDSSR
jgi:hypothetical protein